MRALARVVGMAAPASPLETAWERGEVRRALASLPPGERDIVILGHFGSRTHREIAHELGVPLGTVKSRLTRAYRRLAASLRHVMDAGAQSA